MFAHLQEDGDSLCVPCLAWQHLWREKGGGGDGHPKAGICFWAEVTGCHSHLDMGFQLAADCTLIAMMLCVTLVDRLLCFAAALGCTRGWAIWLICFLSKSSSTAIFPTHAIVPGEQPLNVAGTTSCLILHSAATAAAAATVAVADHTASSGCQAVSGHMS